MASKVKKGFLYYLIWFFFIAFGIVTIFASILIFNPGKDIFGVGLKYYSDRVTQKINEIEVDGNKKSFNDTSLGINTIKFTSNYANFQIIKNNSFEKITFLFDKKINGFTKDKELTCNLDITINDSVLNIETVEPNFWLPLSKSLTVKMYCPINYSFEGYTFDLTTASGNINLSGSEDVDIDLAKLNINSDSGSVNLFENVNIKTGEVNIISNKSNINVYCNVEKNLTVDVAKGKLYVKKINGDLNVNSTNMSVKCGTILGNVTYASHSGYIRVEKIGNSETTGNFTAVIDKLHIANVTIGEMTGNVSIPNAKDSRINIASIKGIGLIETTSGTVNVEKCYNSITINTSTGNINLTQLNPVSTTNIKTKSGTVNVNFAKIGNATLETEKSAIKINVATDESFIFDYSSAKATSISWIKEDLEKSGQVYVAGATESTTSKITAMSNTGKIYLSDGFVA